MRRKRYEKEIKHNAVGHFQDLCFCRFCGGKLRGRWLNGPQRCGTEPKAALLLKMGSDDSQANKDEDEATDDLHAFAEARPEPGSELKADN